jgi:hypothetical protein
MSSIINDIVEDVQVKPNKAKLILKWTVRIAVSLIGIAFVVGQLKIKSLTKINDFENSLIENTQAINELRLDVNNGFSSVNSRINKVYDDGFNMFNEFQEYNDEQLKLIIDYGNTNKDLLKRMIDLNSLEKTMSVKNQIEQEKGDTMDFSITIRPTDGNVNK